MKTWILVIALTVLLIAGTFTVMALNKTESTNSDSSSSTIKCSSCGGSCSAEKNCGLATCGAVSGTGSCGCGKTGA